MAPVSKNSLSIRLVESAVFLRSDYTHSRRNNDSTSSSTSPDSLLRGLLVLDLAKPTRITKIEVHLTAVAATSCPEGVGARRLEINEQHCVFQASTILFCSSAPGSYSRKPMTGIASTLHRRSVSIGPGISYTQMMHQSTTNHNENEQVSWEDLSRSRQPTPSPPRIPAGGMGPDAPPSIELSPSARPSLSLSTPQIPPYSPQPADHMSYPNSTIPSLPSSSGLRRPSFTQTIVEDESESPENNNGQMDVTPAETSESYHPEQDSRPTTSSPSLEQQRGRLHTRNATQRFSLSAVPNLLLGAVSASPRRSFFSPGNDDDVESQREKSVGRSLIRGRGRTTERHQNTRDSTLEDGESSNGGERRGKEEKERTSMLAKLLGEREEWSQEFQPGTYTYPITFSIPSTAPPTMQLDYGSISWKLKAFVHRPGTFQSKLSAERDLIVVACPTEDDTEDSENIIVERNWDQHLQYLISISGRAFFIGGTIPISIVLMPMDKIKVHRITVSIEEKVEYFSRYHRLLRSDLPARTTLLSVRNEGKTAMPILPLESSSVEVLRSSPLFELLDPEERRDKSKLDELAANFMGPGPWTFHKDLKLPNSCKVMKFSNKNLRANVRIGHVLKVILRLEKTLSGEDLHKAKPALFDIVVQVPVLILSCRCNPEWASLPRYTEVFDDMIHDITPICPCQVRHQSTSPSAPSSTDSLIPETSKSAVPLTSYPSPLAYTLDSRQASPHSEYAESIVRSSSLFERLVSGQESETGEAPPAYRCLEGGFSQSSISVAVRAVPLNVARSGISV